MSLASSMMKKLNTKTVLGTAIFAHAYTSAKGDGADRTSAAVKAVGETAIASIIHPGVYIGAKIALSAPNQIVSSLEQVGQMTRSMERASSAPFLTNTFIDNRQIFTMRQAGVSAMQQAKYNAEQAIMGNEAQYLHR